MISAFGLAVELALDVPELEAAPPVRHDLLPSGPPLRVQMAAAEELDTAWSGPATPAVESGALVDGSRWHAERGRSGDLRMEHVLGRFHLDPAATLLRCAPSDAADPAWRRLLLDTALVSASLARGREALHAACVVSAGVAVAIAGPSEAGKTTLMAELMRAGADFLADDVVALADGELGVLALPGPPVSNLPTSSPADDLAERLHRFGDEWWVRMRRPCLSPAPLRVVLVLDRPGAPAGPQPVFRLQETAAVLLGHALQSGAAPRRREQRFALLARLAQDVEVLAVNVDRSRSPRQLVEALQEAVPLLQA